MRNASQISRKLRLPREVERDRRLQPLVPRTRSTPPWVKSAGPGPSREQRGSHAPAGVPQEGRRGGQLRAYAFGLPSARTGRALEHPGRRRAFGDSSHTEAPPLLQTSSGRRSPFVLAAAGPRPILGPPESSRQLPEAGPLRQLQPPLRLNARAPHSRAPHRGPG